MKVRPAGVVRDVLLIEPSVHRDARGHFFERFQEARFAELGLPTTFRQENQSRSRRGVIRGLHFQRRRPQGKLVQCVQGSVFDVAVDLRSDSPTFGRWVGVALDAEHPRLLWVPPGLAHGFCVTSEEADLQYKCTELWDPDDDLGLSWADPELAIAWPTDAPILSERDRALPVLAMLRATLAGAANID